MKKIGTVLIAVLVGAVLYEILAPAIEPKWLDLIIELGVFVIFGIIGLIAYKAMDKGDTKAAT